MKITKRLFSIFDPSEFDIRVQLPFDAPGDSMPEPNFLVCAIAEGQRHPHPAHATLIIEVADTSLTHDRDKALEYAAAGVPEYWIVDINGRCIEVYRDAVSDPTSALGFRYPPPTVLPVGQSIALKHDPQMSIQVADLLP
jgi:Uma2 family endonuclease